MADRFGGDTTQASDLVGELTAVREELIALGRTVTGAGAGTGSAVVDEALRRFHDDTSDQRDRMNDLIDRASALLKGFVEGAASVDRNLAGAVTVTPAEGGSPAAAPAAPVSPAAAPVSPAAVPAASAGGVSGWTPAAPSGVEFASPPAMPEHLSGWTPQDAPPDPGPAADPSEGPVPTGWRTTTVRSGAGR